MLEMWQLGEDFILELWGNSEAELNFGQSADVFPLAAALFDLVHTLLETLA